MYMNPLSEFTPGWSVRSKIFRGLGFDLFGQILVVRGLGFDFFDWGLEKEIRTGGKCCNHYSLIQGVHASDGPV